MKDFPLECECCVCEKFAICVVRDEDLGGALCKDCMPHICIAEAAMLMDLVQCGIIK